MCSLTRMCFLTAAELVENWRTVFLQKRCTFCFFKKKREKKMKGEVENGVPGQKIYMCVCVRACVCACVCVYIYQATSGLVSTAS